MADQSKKWVGKWKQDLWRKRVLVIVLILALISGVWWFLQHVFPHFWAPWPYKSQGLSYDLVRERLSKPTLSEKDYTYLFYDTGLGKPAIDDLLAQGDEGIEQILSTGSWFNRYDGYSDFRDTCEPLGITTREHRFHKEDGSLDYVIPLAPLKDGDVIVTLSTHTAGWNHGHAGLVVDAERGVTLESVVLGSYSSEMDVNHWRSYSTLAVLRPKADDETRQKVVQLAMDKLDNIPYSLVSGAFGDKLQPLDGAHSAHCGYLPWYAWMAVGIDLDSDGGRIAAPADFLHSPNVEVVQIFGMDPKNFKSLELTENP